MGTHARVFLVVAAAIAVNCLAAAPALADFVPTERFSGPGSGDGRLSVPQRAAVEQGTGDLFVVDRGNDRVQVFAPDGAKATYSAQFGSAALDQPLGIAIDQTDGSIYVSDADDVVKFDSSYAQVGSFASPGVTGALAVDPTSGDLLVADRASDRVLRFNSDGSADGAGFDGSTSGTAFTDPIDLAVNSSGDVYVVDQTEDVDTGTGTSRVERFSGTGAHQASISPFGPNQQAARVAVNPDTDALAVSGEQYAVNYNGDATVHFFDSANAPLEETTTTSQYSKVAGMAFRTGTPDALFVVTDVSDYPCTCYGTPEIVAFTDVTPPSATIGPVTEVTEFTATFSGEVDPEGSATGYFFEYSADGGSSWTATETQDLGDTGTDPVPVTFAATGLPDDKALEVRLVATKGGGVIRTESATESFTTLAATDPVANVGAPTDVRRFSATLTGTIDPEGFLTTPVFELSTDGGAGWFEAGEGTPSPVTGTDPVAVSLQVPWLSPATEYQVRLVARDPGGTRHASASSETFTTLALAAPTVTVDPPTGVDADSAVLSGTIDGNELFSQYRFELSYNGGKTWIFSGAFNPTPEGSGPQPVSETVEDLDANKTYEVRIVAIGEAGQTITGGQAFTTDPAAPAIRGASASGVQATQAFLRADVNGFGEATTYYFELGKTTAYGSTAPLGGPTSLGAVNQYLEVTELIENLEPDTTYHFRFVAENTTGETVGPDRTFTTRELADPCPNAAVRKQQDAVRLPDCRAYEQVSEREKFGYPVGSPLFQEQMAVAPSGERALYLSVGPFAGTAHGVPQSYIANRTANGWVSASVSPPTLDPNPDFINGSDTNWNYASRELEVGLVSTNTPVVPEDVNREFDAYTVDAATVEPRLITDGVQTDGPVPGRTVGVALSEDGTHSYFNSNRDLVPQDAGRNSDPGITDVYEHSDGETRLINLDSDENLLNPCGSQLAHTPLPTADRRAGAVSHDGARVFFTVPSTNGIPGEPGCDEWELYLRLNGEQTIHVDRSRLAVPVANAKVEYLGGAADGSVIYFAAEKLTDDAPSVGAVYRYITATDEVEPISSDPVPDLLQPVRVSRDGSTFYFVGRAGPGFTQHLYVYRNNEIRTIADSGDMSFGRETYPEPWGGDLVSGFSSVSADGLRLTFSARAALAGNTYRHRAHVYLYDWSKDVVECITCVEGAPPIGLANFPRATISEDGSTVAVQTAQRLSGDDANMSSDIYRWRDGSGAELISGGKGSEAAELMGLSRDGSSVFFLSDLNLTRQDSDGDVDMYVAREAGGFLVDEGQRGCAGGGCQLPPTAPPLIDRVGSEDHGPDCSVLRASLSRAMKKLAKLRKQNRASNSHALKRKLKSTSRRVEKLRRATNHCEVSR